MKLYRGFLIPLNLIFSSPGHGQSELSSLLGVHRLPSSIIFYIFIFLSETPLPNGTIYFTGSINGRSFKVSLFRSDPKKKNGCNRHFFFLIGLYIKKKNSEIAWYLMWSIYGRSLFLIGWCIKNLLLWNNMAKWINILQKASMQGPCYSFLISSLSDKIKAILILDSWFWLADT